MWMELFQLWHDKAEDILHKIAHYHSIIPPASSVRIGHFVLQEQRQYPHQATILANPQVLRGIARAHAVARMPPGYKAERTWQQLRGCLPYCVHGGDHWQILLEGPPNLQAVLMNLSSRTTPSAA